MDLLLGFYSLQSVMELGRAWGGMQELGEIYDGYNAEIQKLKTDLISAETKAKTASE